MIAPRCKAVGLLNDALATAVDTNLPKLAVLRS
jgi:hypothetical protein